MVMGATEKQVTNRGCFSKTEILGPTQGSLSHNKAAYRTMFEVQIKA